MEEDNKGKNIKIHIPQESVKRLVIDIGTLVGTLQFYTLIKSKSLFIIKSGDYPSLRNEG